MRNTVLVFAFLVAGLVPAGAWADDCTLRQFASLPLVASDDNSPVVDVQIGGRTFHLLVDTGGIYSILNKDAADSLGVSEHDIQNGTEVYEANGARIKNYIEAPDFKLGPIALDKFPMMVARQPMVGKGIDGTLSPDFLSRFDVEFDFAGHKLNLFSSDHCPGKVVYWAKSYVDVPFKMSGTHILLPTTLDGHDESAGLDTGAGITTIAQAVARNVFGLSDTSPGMEHDPDAKPDDLFQYRYRFKSLALNGVAVTNPLIYILPDKANAGFRKEHDEKATIDAVYGEKLAGPDLVMGINVLSKLHLFISYKEKVLYLTAADAH